MILDEKKNPQDKAGKTFEEELGKLTPAFAPKKEGESIKPPREELLDVPKKPAEISSVEKTPEAPKVEPIKTQESPSTIAEPEVLKEKPAVTTEPKPVSEQIVQPQAPVSVGTGPENQKPVDLPEVMKDRLEEALGKVNENPIPANYKGLEDLLPGNQ